MIRLSKLTDYGLVLMSYAARNKGRTVHTARELSLESGLPLPTVTTKARFGLVVPVTRSNGGPAPSSRLRGEVSGSRGRSARFPTRQANSPGRCGSAGA